MCDHVWQKNFLFFKLRQAGTLCCSSCTWTDLSSSNKIQRNYKGLKITECMCSWDKVRTKDTKGPREPNCHFWRVRGKSRAWCMPPALSTPKGKGGPPKTPLQRYPWIQPTLTLHKVQAHRPLRERVREPVTCSCCPPCRRSPNKSSPEFLVWCLVNVRRLGMVKDPGPY